VTEAHAIREQTTNFHVEPCHCPVQAARTQDGQRLGKNRRFFEGSAVAICLAQIDTLRRLVEAAQDEVPHLVHSLLAICFAERVMEKAVKYVLFFHRRPKPLEKVVLRTVMHHPVGAGDK